MDRKQPLPDPQRKAEASRQRGDGETLRTDEAPLEEQSTEAAGHRGARDDMPETDRGFLRDDGQRRPDEGETGEPRLDESGESATGAADRAPETPDGADADHGQHPARSGDDANAKPRTTQELDDAYSASESDVKGS